MDYHKKPLLYNILRQINNLFPLEYHRSLPFPLYNKTITEIPHPHTLETFSMILITFIPFIVYVSILINSRLLYTFL